ncbi:MAG: hypothetical protein U0167_03055 [bacterium]
MPIRRAPHLRRIAAAVLGFVAATPVSRAAAQWTQIFHTPTHEIPHVLSSATDSTCWFITNFDRVYKTSNGGATWTTINSSVFIPQGLFVLNDLVAFKSALGALYRTTDGGLSWNPVFSPGGSLVPEVWMVSETVGFMNHGGVLYRSTDGGVSWGVSGLTQPPAAPGSSTGNGTLWSSGSYLWVGLANDGVAYSPDLAATWTHPANLGLRFSGPPHISFADPSFGLAVYPGSPLVYATTDGGEHWRSPENSLGFNQDVLAVGEHGWYTPDPADHFYIKYTTDHGATWTQQLFDSDGFEVLTRSRTGSTLWAATSIGEIYTYPETIPVAAPLTSEASAPVVAYPNPGRDFVRVGRAVTSQGRAARYRMLSVLGEVVASGETGTGVIDTPRFAPAPTSWRSGTRGRACGEPRAGPRSSRSSARHLR